MSEEEACGERYNPFLSHAFLDALEQSKSVGGRTGWAPAHVLVEDGAGRLVAAAPSYLKSHSMGEYVFDHAWAQAYERSGHKYYPKLQVAVPFTPVTGRRLLVARDAPAGARDALIAALRGLREATEASSIHVTFANSADAAALAKAGFAERTGEQFHFLNEGYADFDAFLAALASRKRKAIKRERREALGDDVEIDLLTGADIKPAHWSSFFAFYMDTGSRKWGRPYLTRDFFDRIGATMADRILLVMARRNGAISPGQSIFWAPTRSMAATGARSRSARSSISRSAITRPSNSPSDTAISGSRRERRASTNSLAATAPLPTYSAHEFADRRFARRSATTSAGSASRSMR